MNKLRSMMTLLVLVFIVTACGCTSKFTITFDTDGGSEIEEVTVRSGEKLERPKEPTKEGYTFDGWFTEEGIAYDFDEEVTSSFTLFARWLEGESYTVRFDSNGGSNIPNQVVFENEKVREPNIPTREGFVFLYWTLEGEEFDFDTPITANITLLAEWQTPNLGENIVMASRPSGGTNSGDGSNPIPPPPITPPQAVPTAEERAEAFRLKYEVLWGLTPVTVNEDDRVLIIEALNELGAFSYTVSVLLSDQEMLLSELLATLDANKFISDYALVLALTPTTVDETDRINIENVLTSLESLSPEVQALLVVEKTLLEDLIVELDDRIETALETALSLVAGTYTLPFGTIDIELELITEIENDINDANFTVSVSLVSGDIWDVTITSVINTTIYQTIQATATIAP